MGSSESAGAGAALQASAQPRVAGYPSGKGNHGGAKLPKRCATEGCDFAVTWHSTHCCHACADGHNRHGGKCEQQRFVDRPHCPREGCRFVVTWHDTHCCDACKQGRGHGPKCEQVAHTQDRCARWFCGRPVTWHASHCCEACAAGTGHGPHCTAPSEDLSRFQLRNRSPLADCKPTDSGGHFQSLVYAKAKTALGSEVDLSLDLRIPEGSGPFPCVVFVHGGAWVRGNFQGFTKGPFGQLLHALGWACASVQYRFVQEASWPAAECDVRAAVRVLRKHAPQLRLNPELFVSMGHSAGGHLAGFLAPAAADAALDGDLRDVAGGESSAVQGIISYAGAVKGARWMQGKGNLVKVAELCGSADGWPPTLLIQGTADALVPKQTAEDFSSALQALKAQVELLVLQGHGHQFHLLPDVESAISNFLKQFAKSC